MAIWKTDINLTLLAQRSANTLATHLDIQFIEIGDNYLIADMPVDERTKQPIGLLNGGASCALAETVGSTAANFVVDQATHYCVGLDLNANHLRPAKGGRVKAKATPIHLGSKTQVWQILIMDEQEKSICIARLTIMVMRRDL